MKRRLLNVLTGLSLLLCVAVVALWVRSFHAYDGHQTVRLFMADRDQHLTGRELHSRRGVLIVRWWRQVIREPGAFYTDDRNGSRRIIEDPVHHHAIPRFWIAGGFGMLSTSEGTATSSLALRTRGVAVPHAFPAFALLLFPGWRLFRAVGRRSAAPGRCPACGYDLRASPGRCPECGTPPVQLG